MRSNICVCIVYVEKPKQTDEPYVLTMVMEEMRDS